MSNVYTVYVHKQWNSIISIRDYVYDKCISNNKGLRILHNDQQMTIPFEQLPKRRFAIHNTLIQGKFGKDYKLVDFKFIPDGASV